MKYISLDIETTGLDTSIANCLMISMIFVDTNLMVNPLKDHKSLTFLIDRDLDKLNWQPKALQMNQWIVDILEGKKDSNYDKIPLNDVSNSIGYFLSQCGYQTNDDGSFTVLIAGANVSSFDLPLLMNDIPGLSKVLKPNRRVIDPSLEFVDWENDERLPGLSICLERAGFNNMVSHNAYDDALQVVQLLEHIRFNKIMIRKAS